MKITAIKTSPRNFFIKSAFTCFNGAKSFPLLSIQPADVRVLSAPADATKSGPAKE
jgi:hypothetical protein